MKNKKDVKTTMFNHSEAKVEFYKQYLELYLRVLYLSPYINKIYLFDMFCGTGIYENGKKGSPIVAADAIKLLVDTLPKDKTEITLVVNDQDASKLEKVKSYIGDNYLDFFDFQPRNSNVNDLFPKLIGFFKNQKKETRNLIFIDPYGYKEIQKDILKSLMINGRTEIILFLPISQMQRFTIKALDSEELAYSHLRKFIYSFFPEKHPIKESTTPPLQYIEYIKVALKFSKYYTTSYYLERDNNNYYALFFISNNIYGYEKSLEVKWNLDKSEGRGYQQPKPKNLFEEHFEVQQKEKNAENLKSELLKFLKNGKKNNVELYKFVLENEFLPKQIVPIINKLFESKTVNVEFTDDSKKVNINMISYRNFTKKLEVCSIKLN